MLDNPSFVTTDPIKAWHWVLGSRRLRDGQRLVDGKHYFHAGEIELCHSGLHASKRIIDALAHAPGPVVCRVECMGRIECDKDKLVCCHRHVLWSLDATDVLREYSRWCALRVIDLWDAPDVVRCWLETGNESLRKKALSESVKVTFPQQLLPANARSAEWYAAVAAERAATVRAAVDTMWEWAVVNSATAAAGAAAAAAVAVDTRSKERAVQDAELERLVLAAHDAQKGG